MWSYQIGLYCPICGKWFEPLRSDAKFCSNACRQKSYRIGKGAVKRNTKQQDNQVIGKANVTVITAGFQAVERRKITKDNPHECHNCGESTVVPSVSGLECETCGDFWENEDCFFGEYEFYKNAHFV